MAESLGDALLYLRTDDTGLEAGMAKAKSGAQGVGTAFDETSNRTSKFSGFLQRLRSMLGLTEKDLNEAGQAAATTGAKFEQSSERIVRASGQQRAGIVQLTQNLGDMSTMYALGARPSQIFASQIGQIAQAIQLTAGEGSKFASFLMGPWGIAIMVAVQLLGPLIGKLLETADAHRDAASAAKQQKQAEEALQNVLQGALDMSEQQRINALQEAEARKVNAKSVLNEAEAKLKLAQANEKEAKTRSPILNRALSVIGRGDPVAKSAETTKSAQADVDQARLAYNTASILQTNLERAAKIAREKEAYDEAQKDQRTADAAAKKAERERAAAARKAQRAAEEQARHDEQQSRELARLDEEELNARLNLATNVQERADLQRELLHRQRDERIRQVQADRDLDDKEKAARIAYINRLYPADAVKDGKGDLVVSPDDSLYGRRLSRQIAQEEAALANEALSRHADALQAQASITDNLKERDRLEREALALQQRVAANLLEQDIANGRIADADKARADLATTQAAAREQLGRSQEGPLARYARGLNSDGENLGLVVENYAVSELEHLRNSLHDGVRKITGTDDPLINGLIEMFLEQTLLRPIANEFASLSGGGSGGLVASVLGGIGSLFGIGGGRANGGAVNTGTIYPVNERSTAPGFFIPLSPGVIEPADAGHATPGRGATVIRQGDYIDMRGAYVDEKLWGQVRAIADSSTQAGIRQYDSVVLDRVREHGERRS